MRRSGPQAEMPAIFQYFLSQSRTMHYVFFSSKRLNFFCELFLPHSLWPPPRKTLCLVSHVQLMGSFSPFSSQFYDFLIPSCFFKVLERRVLHHALTGLKASLKFWAIKGVVIVTIVEGCAPTILPSGLYSPKTIFNLAGT